MRRREFLACFGVVAWSRVLADDQVRRLAIVIPGALERRMYAILMQRLHESGYKEGSNLRVDQFYARGSADRLREMVAEVVASHPDVIFALSGRTVQALRGATTTIPIVGFTSDPMAYGLVNSLSHPGGNVTGTVVDAGAEVWGKRLELLKEIAPETRVVFHV